MTSFNAVGPVKGPKGSLSGTRGTKRGDRFNAVGPVKGPKAAIAWGYDLGEIASMRSAP